MVETISEDAYEMELEELASITRDELDEGDNIHDAAAETVQWHNWFHTRHDLTFYASIIEQSDLSAEGYEHYVDGSVLAGSVEAVAAAMMKDDLTQRLQD